MFIQDLFDQFMLETHIHRKSCASGIPNIDLKLEWLDLIEHKLDHDGAGMHKYGDDMTSNCAQVTTALTYMTNIYNIIQLYTIIISKFGKCCLQRQIFSFH